MTNNTVQTYLCAIADFCDFVSGWKTIGYLEFQDPLLLVDPTWNKYAYKYEDGLHHYIIGKPGSLENRCSGYFPSLEYIPVVEAISEVLEILDGTQLVVDDRMYPTDILEERIVTSDLARFTGQKGWFKI